MSEQDRTNKGRVAARDMVLAALLTVFGEVATATDSCLFIPGLQDDRGLFDVLWLPSLPVRSFSPRADNQFFLSGELFSLSTTSVSFPRGDLKS